MREIFYVKYVLIGLARLIVINEKKKFKTKTLFAGTIGQKICGAAKINCYKEAARTFFSNSISNSNTFRNRCNCLPSCTWIEYNAVVERIKEDTLDSNLNNGLYDDG